MLSEHMSARLSNNYELADGHSAIRAMQQMYVRGRRALQGFARSSKHAAACDPSNASTEPPLSGEQSEAHLPFAGLHQLLRPILADVVDLPIRQREALLAAFGMAVSAAPDLFLIALAALELLAGAAARSPLLLIAGGKDHIAPASVTEANFRLYRHAKAITDYKEFPERSHYTLGEPGWEEVADYALTWAVEHAAAQPHQELPTT